MLVFFFFLGGLQGRCCQSHTHKIEAPSPPAALWEDQEGALHGKTACSEFLHISILLDFWEFSTFLTSHSWCRGSSPSASVFWF